MLDGELVDEPAQGCTALQHTCPRWCTSHDVDDAAEEHGEVVHVSGPFMVKRTVLRLASSLDCATGVSDGPLVYVGDEEYTLYQAEVLIDTLTHLVNEGAGQP